MAELEKHSVQPLQFLLSTNHTTNSFLFLYLHISQFLFLHMDNNQLIVFTCLLITNQYGLLYLFWSDIKWKMNHRKQKKITFHKNHLSVRSVIFAVDWIIIEYDKLANILYITLEIFEIDSNDGNSICYR